MANDTELTCDTEYDFSDVEQAVAEMSALARADVSPQKLADELLHQAVRLLAAIGGSFWLRDEHGSLSLLAHVEDEPLADEAADFRGRVRHHVLKNGASQVTTLPSTGLNGRSQTSPESMLLASPIWQESNVAGVVELVQRGGQLADAVRGNLRFLEIVCQTAGDYLERREVRALRAVCAQHQQIAVLARKLQQSLDLTRIAFELTNEGRRLTGCDRVGLALRRWNGFRLLSVSGVDKIDRRSNAVCRLESLIDAVAHAAEPYWYDGIDQHLPPQILEPLELYLSDSHARGVGVIPLKIESPTGAQSPTLAAIVFEKFGEKPGAELRNVAQAVAEVAQPVIFNALRYESLPTLPFARSADFLLCRPLFRSRAIWAVLAAACILPALAFWPADFFVHARGKLQPQVRRESFAPLDGQVTRLSVRHGDRVQPGAPLLELSNPQLDVESQRLQGEYDTTRKRLAVIESSLLQVGAAKERSRERIEELSAEQEELVKLVDSQRTQLALLAKQREELVVRSPMKGEVLTWEVEQLLKDRPVERGQSLLSIGDLSGPWLAEVMVPDSSIGYLLGRQAAADEPLPASFQLATDRRNQYQGTVRTISSRTETDRDEQAVVKVIVDFDAAKVRELRPGATIFARIHCGQRPLGYVWFHELIETMRGWKFYWSA